MCATALAATGTASSAELPPLAEAKAAFLAEHGSDYGYNGWIDAHWQQEVGVRLPGDQHYLDYTGMVITCCCACIDISLQALR